MHIIQSRDIEILLVASIQLWYFPQLHPTSKLFVLYYICDKVYKFRSSEMRITIFRTVTRQGFS
jgi:hypothetical protein